MIGSDMTRIRSNIQSLILLSNLRDVNSSLAKHQLQMGTGKRINSAADDPPGLTLATKLSISSRVLSALNKNAMQAQDMVAVAEGGLMAINEALSFVKEQVVLTASETLSSAERQAISQQIIAMIGEIDDIAATTEFNGKSLLNGEQTFNFKTSESGTTSWTTAACDSESLGLGLLNELTPISEITSENYEAYLTAVDGAMESISTGLSSVGSLINRLQVKSEMLEVAQTNTEAAYSRIMNADMAETQMKLIRDLILQQTALFSLAASNKNQISVLKLFNLEMFGES